MIPFHVPSLQKPQETYGINPDNSNSTIFPHSSVIESYTYVGEQFADSPDSIRKLVPIKPASLESTPFTYIDTVDGLKVLRNKLRRVDEFAVDLEANMYRSFQGLTCLMQISTRTEDFVVDTLKLHKYVGRYLGELFLDPKKRKVMHGAINDIAWLQRDFHIYVVNLFDTMQASKVMNLERNSLEFLLRYFCGVIANKEYQTSDWRIRPLPREMLHYAREDTHYLLYIYDLMRRRLASSVSEIDEPLVEVYKRSHDLCTTLYEKEVYTKDSYKNIFGLNDAGLNSQQLKVVAELYRWRDQVARENDESTGYVMPNKMLLALSRKMPQSRGEMLSIMEDHNYQNHPYVSEVPNQILKIIMKANIEPEMQYNPRLSGYYVPAHGYYVNAPVQPMYYAYPNFYNSYIIC